MTASTTPAVSARKSSSATVSQAIRDLNLDYGTTLTLSIWGLGRIGVGHVGARVKQHASAKKAREAAGAEYQEFDDLRGDNPEVARRRKDIAVMRDDLQDGRQAIINLHAKFSGLQNVTLYRKCSMVVLSDADNLLKFAIDRSKHTLGIHADAKKTLAEGDGPVSRKEYCVIVEVHTRMRKAIDDIVENLTVCRKLVVDEMNIQRYAAAVESEDFRIGGQKFTEDDVTKAIRLTKNILGGANTGAGVVSAVVPEEGTAQALGAANLVGSVVIREFSAIAESLDRKRRAKAIMKEPAKKKAADDYLQENPLAILDYIIARNMDDLDRALTRAEPAAAVVLSVASYGLDFTGVGGIVAKCVFPFVFPTVRKLVTLFFENMHKNARAVEAAKYEDLRKFKASMVATWATLSGEATVGGLIRDAKANIKEEPSLRKRVQDEGSRLVADVLEIRDEVALKKAVERHRKDLTSLGLDAADKLVQKATDLGNYLLPQTLIDLALDKTLGPVFRKVLSYVDTEHDPGLISNIEMMQRQDQISRLEAFELKMRVIGS
ncbi:hypothetical protein M8542_33815 [Amycolatopsis sp. OK19-0408]|uniref:Uncharacterized protein n=1 Tax=Amycolatopsis iheyensis TaxID=2945988 RepID=A0A9X2NMW5_9PSEU|nr:hypothetical protein [Amycolatopsis iheyensis]MCR6487815.1 hypothetical protein [Amycolatopsis iheyensis]